MAQPSIRLYKLNILVLVCVLAKSLKINMMPIVMYSTNKVTIMNQRHPQNHNLTLHTASQWLCCTNYGLGISCPYPIMG